MSRYVLMLAASAALSSAAVVNRTSLTISQRASRTIRGLASRATNVQVTGTAAVYGINDNENNNSPLNCQAYYGDGSSGDGWPTLSQWVSFDTIWNAQYSGIQNSCNSVYGLQNMSDDEMTDLRNGIEAVANQANLDHRHILAEILTESSGCVRVPTTYGNGIWNPGLMQDFDGYYTCNCQQYDEYNENCGVVYPCPASTIQNMIREGAVGTDNGDGIASLVNQASASGATDAQVFYVASEWYNQGSGTPPVGQSLNANCYASTIAQYVTGCQNPVGC